jgi:hypothetical protein
VCVCLLAEAAKAGITPNHKFLTNYLQGVESGNARAIARNAARGAQKVWQQHNTVSLLATCYVVSASGLELSRSVDGCSEQ